MFNPKRAESLEFIGRRFYGGLVLLGWWNFRAYIQTGPAVVRDFDQNKPAARITMNDVGITPAYHVDAQIWGAYRTSPTCERDLLVVQKTTQSKANYSDMTLFRDTSDRFGLDIEFNRGLSVQEQEQMRDGTLQLFVRGKITYRTLWWWNRYSDFCFRLSGPTWTHQTWAVCTYHNDSN
jgi:hypothetical protein